MSFLKKSGGGADWLAGVTLFHGFSAEELQRVADLGHEIEVAAGSVLVDQGDPGLDCFVIVSGAASVYIAGEYVTSLGEGSVVGEMALIDHRPRNATVVADVDSRLLRFDAPAFRRLLEEMPKANERIQTVLTARLRRNA
mgnify:CR=1 FL=1